MTKRILGLLWRISLASQMHAPLDMTLCFADVLRDYALTSKSADTRELALDYASELVQELNGTDKALPAMRVLTHLIANSGNHAVSPALPLQPTSSAMLRESHCMKFIVAVSGSQRVARSQQQAAVIVASPATVVCCGADTLFGGVEAQ